LPARQGQDRNRPERAFRVLAFLTGALVGATAAGVLIFEKARSGAIAVLPLTGRQLGRGWWLATVPIPAITLAALLFSGAGTCCHLFPKPRISREAARAGEPI